MYCMFVSDWSSQMYSNKDEVRQSSKCSFTIIKNLKINLCHREESSTSEQWVWSSLPKGAHYWSKERPFCKIKNLDWWKIILGSFPPTWCCGPILFTSRVSATSCGWKEIGQKNDNKYRGSTALLTACTLFTMFILFTLLIQFTLFNTRAGTGSRNYVTSIYLSLVDDKNYVTFLCLSCAKEKICYY